MFIFDHFKIKELTSHLNKEFNIKQYQEKKLKELFNFVKENNNYLSRKYRGFHFNNLLDIKKIPILKKNELKIEGDGYISKGYRKENLISSSTTGSTGSPLTLFFDKDTIRKRQLNIKRWETLLGKNVFSKQILLWRKKNLSFIQNILSKLGLFRLIPVVDDKNVTSLSLNKEKLNKIIQEIENFNPEFIRGYVSFLKIISNHIINNNIKLNLSNLKNIITSAEYVDDNDRKIFKKAFGVNVIDIYGGTEAPLIASEIPNEKGYIVWEDKYLVEIVDNKGNEVKNGEIGKILITDLDLKSFPLIRYEIGDLAIKGGTSSFGFLKLEKIIGRTNDIFTLPNGNKIISHFWHIYFREINEIEFFKVTQTKRDTILIELKPIPGKEKDLLIKKTSIINSIKKKINCKNMKIYINIVNDLNFSKGGKFKSVESLIK